MAKKGSSAAKMALGLGAAAAVAAAGAYFFYGKHGARNRKAVKTWALKAKAEVLEQMEKLPRIDEQTYKKIVDGVVSRYKTLKKATPAELAQTAAELKRHWNAISRQLGAARPAGKRKAAKKAAKKRRS